MPRAFSIPGPGTPIAEAPALAARAEELGYESIWIPEVASNDAFALGCAIAMTTKTARIGTAVVPANTRGPAMLAMAASTLHQVSKGRSVCGIGVSSEAIVSDWNGQPCDRPIGRIKDTVDFLRQSFAGSRVQLESPTVKTKNFRLIAPPADGPPIYVGALNAGMLRLAGRVADGVVLNLIHEELVPEALKHVHEGARQAGKDPSQMEVVMRAQVYVGDDPKGAQDLFARAFAPYVIARGYNQFFRWQGFDEDVNGVEKALATRDREAARAAMSDRLLETMSICGSAAEVKARIEAYEAAGVTTVAVGAFSPLASDVEVVLQTQKP